MASSKKPLIHQQAREFLEQSLRDYLAGDDPGVISFSLKRSKKPGETYPLKLTQLQRETLLGQTRLKPVLKRKIRQAGEGTRVVGVTWNELHQVIDAAGEAAVSARSPHRERLMAIQVRVGRFIEAEHEPVFGWLFPKPPRPRRTKAELQQRGGASRNRPEAGGDHPTGQE